MGDDEVAHLVVTNPSRSSNTSLRSEVPLVRLALGLLPPVTFLGLYARIIRFPYFWDDLYILAWTHSVGVMDILTGVGFFRFRIFDRLLFRFAFDWLGPQGATAIHFLSLTLGMVNVALVTSLARDLAAPGTRRWLTGSLAGLAFVLFAPGYRDIACGSAIAHLAVTTTALAATVLAACFQRTFRWPFLLFSLLMAVVAPLAAETGVLVGFLAAGYVGLKAIPHFTPRVMWTITLYVGTSLLLGAGVAFITRGGVATNTLPLLWDKAFFFLQTLIYPLAPAARWLTSHGATSPFAVAVISLALVPILLILLIRPTTRPLIVFGLLWFGLTSALPWYALISDYIFNAPQIYYLGSVGAALVWAAFVASTLEAPSFRARRLVISLCLAWLATNYAWISHSFNLYALGVRPLRALARAADQHVGGHLLAINLPGWLAWPDPWLPLGNEGAIVLSDESPAELFARFNFGKDVKVKAVHVPDLQGLTPFYAAAHGQAASVDGLTDALRAANAVYLTDYQSGGLTLLNVGEVISNAALPSTPLARFSNGLLLNRVNFQVEGKRAEVGLDWQLTATPTDHNFFVHLFDCAGNVLALADGPAVGRLYPLRAWQPGDAVHDVRHAVLTSLSADKCYSLEIGLFDNITGIRVPVRDAVGNVYPNDAISLTYP